MQIYTTKRNKNQIYSRCAPLSLSLNLLTSSGVRGLSDGVDGVDDDVDDDAEAAGSTPPSVAPLLSPRTDQIPLNMIIILLFQCLQ